MAAIRQLPVPTTAAGSTLTELEVAYRLSLEAQNKTPRTIATYTETIDRLEAATSSAELVS